MSAILLLKEYKELVDKSLEDYFNQELEKAELVDSSAKEMLELIKEYTLRGGKRIRAALIYYGYRLFKDNKLDQVIKASMCIELIQSYLLIHDDIMDRDSLRRGKPTMHKMYEAYHTEENLKDNKEHFGASMAIIAGDICCHMANEILADINLEDRYKLAAIKHMNRLIMDVINGQALDVLSEVNDDTKVETVFKIHKLKTSRYTIEAPLVIGALLAGASKDDIETLSRYSVPLGQAFQIQDDILGVFGDEKNLGKPIGSDITEGKKTLLTLKAYEAADEEQKKRLDYCIGNKNITVQDIEDFKKIIEITGSKEYSLNIAKELIEKANKNLKELEANQEAKEFLIGIADYILRRDY